MTQDYSRITRQVAADIVVDPTGQEGDATTIQEGIDLLNPGGTVFVRAGNYQLSSTVNLVSNLCLIFSAGATITKTANVTALNGDALDNVKIIGAKD